MSDDGLLLQCDVRREAATVPSLRTAVDALARSLGFDDETRGAIALATAEACNNAVVHGFGDRLVLRGKIDDGLLILEVENATQSRLPASPADMPAFTQESGRGRALMESLMDRVVYRREHDKVTVRLFKNLPQEDR
jgi:serine/threonine-protein kinase RsbW